jgi:amphi-Trp domain-containing protein
MPEEILFESESVQTRAAVAQYLRRVADNLDAGEEITFSAGEQSVTTNPPDSVEFEVKVEREGPTGAAGELSIELELEWDENEGEGGDGPLEIE